MMISHLRYRALIGTFALLFSVPTKGPQPPMAPCTIDATYRYLTTDELTAQQYSFFTRQTNAIGYLRSSLAKKDKLEYLPLFAALIHQESNYSTIAVSEHGAVGLCQFKADTAEELGLRVLDLHPSTLRELFKSSPDPAALDERVDVEKNIDACISYILANTRRFDSIDYALLAHNLGPTALEKKLSQKTLHPYTLIDVVEGRKRDELSSFFSNIATLYGAYKQGLDTEHYPIYNKEGDVVLVQEVSQLTD